jgi:UDP-glucose 4-epimerase
MRVLVTGSAGFIGSAVRAELQTRGMTMVGFDHPRDVCDRGAVREAVSEVDAIINLAGVLGTTELFSDEHRAVEVNIGGALSVFDAARKCVVPVVQIATGHRGQLNPYAITKAAAEDAALARSRYAAEQITVVRAYHVYGPGQKPPPPHGSSPVRKIVPSFACRALTGMPLEVYGSGQQQIDLVHVEDVARVLVDAIGGPYGTVVEAGTGKPTTVLDAAMTVIQQAGEVLGGVFLNVPIEGLPMRPGEPPDATVVADSGACPNPWPWRLGETIQWYHDWLASR